MMWHGDWSGGDWALMSVMMVLFWALIVTAAIWLVRTLGDRGHENDRGPASRGGGTPDRLEQAAPSARDILDERYARGEISGEEYRARRDVLSGR